jgi:hypothetical protein
MLAFASFLVVSDKYFVAFIWKSTLERLREQENHDE